MTKTWEAAHSKTPAGARPNVGAGTLTPPVEAHINHFFRPGNQVRQGESYAFTGPVAQKDANPGIQRGQTVQAELNIPTNEDESSVFSSTSGLKAELPDDWLSNSSACYSPTQVSRSASHSSHRLPATDQGFCGYIASDTKEADQGTKFENQDPANQSLRRRCDSRVQKLWSPALPSIFHNDLHLSHDLQEKTYILQVCRVLMMYGAPTHRLEDYMRMTAEVIGLPLQTFYMPGCMIISFSGAYATLRSSEVHLVRTTQSLNLSKLYDVHFVYKDVIHKKVTVEEAIARLDEIMVQRNQYTPWVRVLMYGLASMSIGPVSFGARPIDLPFIFLLSSMLGFMELIVAPRSELYAHVFEISSTLLISFLARAIGSVTLPGNQTFCFSAICQASLLMILPGFTITNGALELQTKNIVSGSVRMVYAIIYTLFLAFGITVGVGIYGAIDKNATSSTTCSSKWPFWWQVIFIPPFTLCWIVVNNGKWAKMPSMITITLVGWLVTYFSQQYFSKSTQIAQMLGALSVGLLANLSSRLWHDLAAALLHPAIFIQVPGSLAISGGLLSGLSNAGRLTGHDANMTSEDPASSTKSTAMLYAGYSMIEIAIAITVGLSVSALLIYPLRRGKGGSGLFTF